jgi:phage FluMu protein Com
MQFKTRTCLRCDKQFDSAGPGNRICPRCSRINMQVKTSEASLQKQRGVKRHNGEVISPESISTLLPAGSQ